MKHKVVGLSFFFCLVAPIVATFGYLYYQKSRVRAEVLHQIFEGRRRDELVLLKFTKEETETKLRWEHAREFEYENNMYDIVETEILGDTILYWCWWDHEETVLNRQLDDLVSAIFGNNPWKKQHQEQLIEFYKNLFYTDYSAFPLLLTAIKTKHQVGWIDRYTTINHSPPVPPPWVS